MAGSQRCSLYRAEWSANFFFQRHPYGHEPHMQIHLRCLAEYLLKLQKLCLALHKDMDNLCSEYS